MVAIFTAGDGGYDRFRIPALAWNQNALVAFAEGRWNAEDGDHGDINVVCRRSTDGGTTWGALQIVLSHGADTAGNPTVVTDPISGDLVLITCRNRGADDWEAITSGAAPARRVYVQRSSDSGATWSAAVEISSSVRLPDWRWYASGPGHGVALPSGRLVVPCNHSSAPAAGSSDDGTEAKYSGNHAIISDDGGSTWSLGFISSSPDGEINEGETTAAALPDGSGIYFNARHESGQVRGNRVDTWSPDGTSLLLPFQTQGTITSPIVQGSVIGLDGMLVYSGPGFPLTRKAMEIRSSFNGGRSWSRAKRLNENPAAYSDMVALGPRTLGLVYETGTSSPYEKIEFTKVTL